MNRHIKRFEVSEPNKKIIQDYVAFKKIQKNNISPRTLESIQETLKKLADFAKYKKLSELSEQDLQEFYKSIESESYRSKDNYATNIIQFYRWIFKLHKKTRPLNMEWYTYTSNATKRKMKDIYAKEKYYILSEEYKKMIDWSNDQYGQTKAIWETLYLGGLRPTELLTMKIKDVTIRSSGIILIKVTDSKTIPREIPLGNEIETPYNLLHYMRNIPSHKTPENYLWFPLKNTTKDRPLQYNNLKNERFNKMKKEIPLKNTLTLKSFRKTRATIIFNNQINYNLTIKDIAKIFGWTPQTAIIRQDEYLLTDNEELIKKLRIQSYIEPTQEQLKNEKVTTIDELRKEQKSIIDRFNSANRNIIQYDIRVNTLTNSLNAIENIINKLKSSDKITKKEFIKAFNDELIKIEFKQRKKHKSLKKFELTKSEKTTDIEIDQ